MTLSASAPYVVRETFIGTLGERRVRFIRQVRCEITLPVFPFYLKDYVRNAAPIRRPPNPMVAT